MKKANENATIGEYARFGKCNGGCSFWECDRPINHPGPCYPKHETAKDRFEASRKAALEYLKDIKFYLTKNSQASIERDWADVGTMAHYANMLKEIHDSITCSGEYAG